MVKKEKKKGEKAIVGPAAPPEINENNKEYYIVQIKDLEDRVSAYQVKCDELEIRNAEYQVKLDRIVDDQNDVVSFIEKKYAKKCKEMVEVIETTHFMQAAKVEEQLLFEEQFEALTNEYNEVKENLTRENDLLASKIQALNAFKENRNNLYLIVKDLETELFNQEAEHRDARYILDKQHLIEKDKLKQEMIQQVKLVANEFKRITQMQMSENTKRTIRENVAIHNQLMKMSEKTTELIDENDELKVKILKQKREIKILEDNAKKLIKKNVCNHQTLTLLKAKCQTLGDTLTRGVIETKDRLEELVNESKTLGYELKQAKNSLKELHSKNKTYEKEKERLLGEVAEKEMLKIELEKLITSSAIAIEKLIKPGAVENCEELSNNPALKREQLLEVLLVLLNSAQSLESLPRESQLSSTSLATKSVENLRIMQKVPQYKPGYLGLIPYGDIFPIEEKGKELPVKHTAQSCYARSKLQISKPQELDEKTKALAEELMAKASQRIQPKNSCKLPPIAYGGYARTC